MNFANVLGTGQIQPGEVVLLPQKEAKKIAKKEVCSRIHANRPLAFFRFCWINRWHQRPSFYLILFSTNLVIFSGVMPKLSSTSFTSYLS